MQHLVFTERALCSPTAVEKQKSSYVYFLRFKAHTYVNSVISINCKLSMTVNPKGVMTAADKPTS